MRTERWALRTIVVIFLLPFFVLAFVAFAPINDEILIGHAKALTIIVPGLSKSFLNIQQYSSTLNAAKFVTIYFWSFTSVCTISVILGMAFGFTRKLYKIENNGNKDHVLGISAPRDPRRMVGPALFVMCCVMIFLFAPVAYVPSTGTSVDKAYFGSTLAAVGMSSLFGVFLFLLTASLISIIYKAVIKFNVRG